MPISACQILTGYDCVLGVFMRLHAHPTLGA
jgi:hypothetical protein